MHSTMWRRLAGAVMTLAVLTVAGPAPAAPRPGAYTKVMLIVEENRTYGEIIDSPDAPYLTALARSHGTATRMTANYPVGCPSLAAYLLITGGTTAGICDDKGPRHHRLAVPNIFAQLDAAHRPWRNYAEDLPSPCARRNSRDGIFLVRHTAVPYYTRLAGTCRIGQVELGAPAAGPLHDALAAGRLPVFSFVTPNACHDMHGARPCPTGRVAAGDRWLKTWIPRVLAGADYQAGRLVVIITWDEGSATSNHIPTLVLSPTTRGVVAHQPRDHCSTLGTMQEILHLPPLGCARSARTMTADFALRP
jgi:hypothetical protein